MASIKMSRAQIERLCAQNKIEIRKADEFMEFDGWSPEDAGKYCVTVPACVFDSEVVRNIPLAKTPLEAKKLAVQHLRLGSRARFKRF